MYVHDPHGMLPFESIRPYLAPYVGPYFPFVGCPIFLVGNHLLLLFLLLLKPLRQVLRHQVERLSTLSEFLLCCCELP